MADCTVYDKNKKKVSTIKLNDEVFDNKVKPFLVHQVITAQRAHKRAGTASTKTRSEVRGGGRKPYKQKGTGNARRGSQVSPILVGGGQAFGPKPRKYQPSIMKKVARAAMVSALSDKFQSEHLAVLKDLKFEKAKTKDAQKMIDKFGWNKALFVDEKNNELELSTRNIPGMKALRSEGLNVYDIVKHDWLVLSESAAKLVNDQYAGVRVEKVGK